MLSSLYIENILLIDKLEVNFQQNMSVVTGETGAGKSIIFDCISLLFKGKSTSEMLRVKNANGIIVGCFVIKNSQAVKNLLQEQDMNIEEGILTIRRVIKPNGVSKIYICDIPSTVSFAECLSKHLIDIHSQSSSLRNKNNISWINLIDKYTGCENEVKEVGKSYQLLLDMKDQYDELLEQQNKASARQDELLSMVDELMELDIEQDEEEDLVAKRNDTKMYAKISDELQNVIHSINDVNILGIMQKCEASIMRLTALLSKGFEEDIISISQNLEKSSEYLNEAINTMNSVIDSMKTDAENFNTFEDRLHAIRSVARKYNTLSSNLLQKLHNAKVDLEEDNKIDEDIESMALALKKHNAEFLKKAHSLSSKRAKAAKNLEKDVIMHCKDLHMENIKFEVNIQTDQLLHISKNGIDKIEFLLSLNEGFDMKPVDSIASGGELSRLLLALKVAISGSIQSQTVIFDEIDTGVSGAIASAIGKKLKVLGDKTQVIAITHNHHVAGYGDSHLHVVKNQNVKGLNNLHMANIAIKELTKAERIDVIANIMGAELESEDIKAVARQIITNNN